MTVAWKWATFGHAQGCKHDPVEGAGEYTFVATAFLLGAGILVVIAPSI